MPLSRHLWLLTTAAQGIPSCLSPAGKNLDWAVHSGIHSVWILGWQIPHPNIHTYACLIVLPAQHFPWDHHAEVLVHNSPGIGYCVGHALDDLLHLLGAQWAGLWLLPKLWELVEAALPPRWGQWLALRTEPRGHPLLDMRSVAATPAAAAATTTTTSTPTSTSTDRAGGGGGGVGVVVARVFG